MCSLIRPSATFSHKGRRTTGECWREQLLFEVATEPRFPKVATHRKLPPVVLLPLREKVAEGRMRGYPFRVRKLLFFACLLLGLPVEAKPKLDTTNTQTRDVEFVKRGAKSLSLRLVRPLKIGKTPLPVVLYFHGGAWLNGSHQKLSPVLLDLARAGIAVASVEFRSSQEAHFPAPLDDARAAVRWVKDNAKSHSLDPNRIGVYGLSTGGLFAGLLAYSGSSVQAACLQSAPSDLNSLAGKRFDWQAPSSPLGALMGFDPQSNREALKRASPIFYADEDAPPTLLLCAAQDEFILPSQSEALNRTLKKAGARVQLVSFKGEDHDLRGAQNEVARSVLTFFKRELKVEKAHSIS